MGEVLDFYDRVKRYYKLSLNEIRSMLLAIAVTAFIISFDEWGTGDVVDLSVGTINFINAALIVILSFLVRDAGLRLWAIGIGYRMEYKVWGIGLVLGVIAAFLTNGNIWLILPGGFMIHHLAAHRLGWFRYGINYFAQGTIAYGGILATMLLVVILKILALFSPTVLIEKAIIFNIIYAIVSLLPIPPLEGSKIYWGSRMMYAFFAPTTLIAAILFMTPLNIFISLLISIVIGTAAWLAYYTFFEQYYWEGPN